MYLHRTGGREREHPDPVVVPARSAATTDHSQHRFRRDALLVLGPVERAREPRLAPRRATVGEAHADARESVLPRRPHASHQEAPGRRLVEVRVHQDQQVDREPVRIHAEVLDLDDDDVAAVDDLAHGDDCGKRALGRSIPGGRSPAVLARRRRRRQRFEERHARTVMADRPRGPDGPQPGGSGSRCSSVSVSAKRSPCSATRSSTSAVSKASGSPPAAASTSSHVTGVDTVGRGRARSE